MITREEAAALLAASDLALENSRGGDEWPDESKRLRNAAPQLARTVVALYDERDALEAAALEARGRLSEALHELIAHRDNQRGALAAIQATAESAEKYAAKADALALELRRLRAAEAPGTDDAAFEGTGWRVRSERAWVNDNRPVWLEVEWVDTPDGTRRIHRGLWFCWVDGVATRFTFALDAMRAAVPGSV